MIISSILSSRLKNKGLFSLNCSSFLTFFSSKVGSDKYKIDDLSKHLLMGHSLGNDIEKSVYGHRTLEELRTEIEKIKVPNFK